MSKPAEAFEVGATYPYSNGGHLDYATVRDVYGRGRNRVVVYVLRSEGAGRAAPSRRRIRWFRANVARGREIEMAGRSRSTIP